MREMLGSIDDSVIMDLLEALAAQDASALLQVVDSASERSLDIDTLLQDLLLALHRLSLAQVAPEVVDALGDEPATFTQLARAITPEDVQLYYQIGLMGRRDLPFAPDPRSGLEMILLRMLAFRPASVPGGEGEVRTAAAARRAAPAVAAPTAATATSAASAARAGVSTPPMDKPDAAQRASAQPASPPSDWAGMVEQLRLTGLVRELAANASLDSYADGVMRLTLDATFAHLLNKERETALKETLQTLLGQALTLQIKVGSPVMETPAREKLRNQDERQQAATAAIAEDPNVLSLQEAFNARINPGSIRPKV